MFDTQTLEALRRAKGANEGKVIDLVRGLRTEIDENPDAAPVLLPLKDRAERVLKDLESRNTTSMEALDMLATLTAEREAATKSMHESGLSPKAFSIFWALKEDATLNNSKVNPMDLAKESEILMGRYPNANVNPEENRQLRTKLYTPLLKVQKEERNRIVDLIISIASR
jgi:type I restriction enzyme R subunit